MKDKDYFIRTLNTVMHRLEDRRTPIINIIKYCKEIIKRLMENDNKT